MVTRALTFPSPAINCRVRRFRSRVDYEPSGELGPRFLLA